MFLSGKDKYICVQVNEIMNVWRKLAVIEHVISGGRYQRVVLESDLGFVLQEIKWREKKKKIFKKSWLFVR